MTSSVNLHPILPHVSDYPTVINGLLYTGGLAKMSIASQLLPKNIVIESPLVSDVFIDYFMAWSQAAISLNAMCRYVRPYGTVYSK